MIKRAKDIEVKRVNNLRGGKKRVNIKHLIQGDELKDKAKMISKITLPKGASIGYHDHTEDFEVYYILSGVGVVDDNGNITKVSKGDVIYTCDGATHSIENTGENDLEFIAIVINE
ncbi:cupin domain-containing protein [Romboutsia lituseburensis]|nr:cupin domain-containing protein [Romboutsia lituseburensis]